MLESKTPSNVAAGYCDHRLILFGRAGTTANPLDLSSEALDDVAHLEDLLQVILKLVDLVKDSVKALNVLVG